MAASDARIQSARGWGNVLAEIPIFAGLSRRHLNRVGSIGTIVRFEDRSAIVRSGDPGDALYVVVDGDVTVKRPRAKPIQMGRGAFFGEMALLDGGPRSATVTARGPVTCLRIRQSGFAKLLRSEPTIALALLRELAARLRAAEPPSS